MSYKGLAASLFKTLGSGSIVKGYWSQLRTRPVVLVDAPPLKLSPSPTPNPGPGVNKNMFLFLDVPQPKPTFALPRTTHRLVKDGHGGQLACVAGEEVSRLGRRPAVGPAEKETKCGADPCAVVNPEALKRIPTFSQDRWGFGTEHVTHQGVAQERQ